MDGRCRSRSAASSQQVADEEVATATVSQAPAAAPPNLAVTRWWSGGAVGLQAAWEASVGWFDPVDVTNANEVSDQVRYAGQPQESKPCRRHCVSAGPPQRRGSSRTAAAQPRLGRPCLHLDGCQGTLGSLGPHFLGRVYGWRARWLWRRSYTPSTSAPPPSVHERVDR